MQAHANFPEPIRDASLLLSFRLQARTVVIVGSGKLAASRAFSSLESDAQVVILGRGGLGSAHEEICWRVEQGEVEWRSIEEEALRWKTKPSSSSSPNPEDEDEAALHSVLSSVPSVSLVCITDTTIPSNGTLPLSSRSSGSASRLYEVASRIYRIPTNTTDIPALCDFTFPSTHRFRSGGNGEPTSLQIGVVTNSKGCRLSSRIIREIVARLPKSIGNAVDNVGRLRDKAKAEDSHLQSHISQTTDCSSSSKVGEKVDWNASLPLSPNEPVDQLQLGGLGDRKELDETPLSRTRRRMRWVAQISEYWPLESLASLDNNGIDDILRGGSASVPRAFRPEEVAPPERIRITSAPTHHTLLISPPLAAGRGRILLLGSGPGHPSLLTLATFDALRSADLVLSDKLVPEGVLKVIPENVELRIARKFPGNADRAQEELMHAAVEGAQQGKVVVRLKQGDPMLYARASSEIEFFTANGFPPAVIPGLSSAFAAPLAAGIPVTARGVAESVAICTGVGKGGKGGRIPSYERGTTLLVLMGVARLTEIVRTMVEDKYPDYLPTCIIERGTMPDQRVVHSTLGNIVEAMTDPQVGAQRPPGMMVVGWSCLGVAEGVEGVSEDQGEGLKGRDLARIDKWLGGERFTIKEGLDESWEGI